MSKSAEEIALDLRRIKDLSWANTQSRPKDKFLSVGKVIEACREPTNFEEVAQKCSVNPSHEHFGKEPAAILEIWQNKSNTGAGRGNVLDNYIHNKLHGTLFDPASINDEIMLKKTQVFDKLKTEILDKHGLKPCAHEIWVTSKTGVRGKIDELFHLTTPKFDSYLVADWKNTENIQTFNPFKKLLGPLGHLDDCELVRYFLQADIYCYILETEFDIDAKASRIFQIKAENYDVPKRPEKLPYDRALIKALIEYTTKSLN